MTADKGQETGLHATGLAGRYANAVFALAQEQKSVDRVSADFAALKNAMAGSPDLARVVRSPVFGRDEQAGAMKAVLAKMGASDLAIQFVMLLVAKRRLFALTEIIATFERLLARMHGEVEAEVTSARALTGAQKAELRAVLKSGLGREPRLDAKVDPGLLGGLIVKVGSRMIDSSLRTKLGGLRAAMRGH